MSKRNIVENGTNARKSIKVQCMTIFFVFKELKTNSGKFVIIFTKRELFFHCELSIVTNEISVSFSYAIRK